MAKLEELEKELEKHQARYEKLLKADKAASARYGDEFRDIQLRVLESAIVEIKREIMKLKKQKMAPINDDRQK